MGDLWWSVIWWSDDDLWSDGLMMTCDLMIWWWSDDFEKEQILESWHHNILFTSNEKWYTQTSFTPHRFNRTPLRPFNDRKYNHHLDSNTNTKQGLYYRPKIPSGDLWFYNYLVSGTELGCKNFCKITILGQAERIIGERQGVSDSSFSIKATFSQIAPGG